MKRPYLIILTLVLFSNYIMIANGQQSKKQRPKPSIDNPINVDTSEFKNNITAPYNLFYLSKYLDNPTLNSTETEMIYGSLVNLVGKDKLDAVGKDSPYSTIANFKKKAINVKALFITKLLNENKGNKAPGSLKTLAELLEDYNRKNDEIAAINEGIGVLNIRKRDVDNAITVLKNPTQTTVNQDSIIKKYQDLLDTPRLSISSIDQLNTSLDLQKKSLDDSLKKEIAKLDTSGILIKCAKKLSEDIDKETKHLADSLLRNGIFSMDIKSYFNEQHPAQKESFQINLTTVAQNAQQGLNYTGLSIPSQSQMIDAMAMFLAKRAKQEAAIWFMDQLRKRVNNPLIYDVFPATIQLLDGLSDYRTANFGTSWRYAISKDFVEMPRNVSKSSWTRQFLTPQNAANLEIAVELGYNIDGLIKARYNYRDIIRQLYLNPSYSPDPNISTNIAGGINQYSHNIIALLYIVTNELFTIKDKNTYRLLGYEELKTLDKKQWDILIELLRLKYGEVFENLPGTKKDMIDKKDKIIAWLSPILLSLGQFDKINQEQQALIEKNKSDQINHSFSNTWNILAQVISNFENYPLLNNNDNNDQYLKNIKNVFDIVENIQEKNFVAATQNTLALVDSYYKAGVSQNLVAIEKLKKFSSKKHPDKEYELKYDANKTPFTIKFNNKETIIEKEDLEYIKYLGTNLQRLDENDRSGFITTSKKTIQGRKVLSGLEEIAAVLPRDSSNNRDLIYLINRIALYKIVSETNNPSEQAAAISLFSGSISKMDKLVSVLPKLSEMSYADQLVKLSGFFGDVISSSSSAELANVIESHALPPTSYKLKRKMSSSVDLNAYVGAFTGRIIPIGNSSLNCKWTGGITAPIGVTIRPAGTFFKYFNFNVQLLELGNLVNHYLITPDSAYNKDVHFSEVFSPGANILYNIKNTPIVAFIGGKLLPLKAYYDEGLKKRINDNAFDAAIFSIGLKIDIPLVNLYSGE